MTNASSDIPLGSVVAVSGSAATLRLASVPPPADRFTVGKFVRIEAGDAVLIAVVTRLASGNGTETGATAEVDLLGEVERGSFQRGVTKYPPLGAEAHAVSGDLLRLVYDLSATDTIRVGALQQDSSIPAYVKVDDLLAKHFALFGTTGVGKSSGVALLLRGILATRPELRVFLVDPHNEYGRCFGERALVLNPKNLRLPFWLFNFEETVDVFFRGRPGVEEETEILAEAILRAKEMFAVGRDARFTLRRRGGDATFTVDTPVPYRLADLVAAISERMGKLENRSLAGKYARLINRIESVRKDLRYAFMFAEANVGGDSMVEVLAQLFRLPPEGKPMTVMQLAGFPTEVVDSVVSVLGRMAFDFGLWSDGAFPLLFVCEEAHRYAPADRSLGFGPTRKAISRIAKEGRKYGVHLGLVTQRPAELDATIISQMSTIFAMRMANERDQAIIRAAVSDAAASLLSFVPSLGTREVFAFGEGVALPTRLRFAELPPELLPRSKALGAAHIEPANADRETIAGILERWRGASSEGRPGGDTNPWGADELAPGFDRDPFEKPRTPEQTRPGANSGPHAADPTFWPGHDLGRHPEGEPLSEWRKHSLAQASRPLRK